MTPGMPSDSATWVALATTPLDPEAVRRWVGDPSCGALVVFTGTVRDHAPERSGVTALRYEAYESQVEPRLAACVDRVRDKVPDVVKVAAVHRIGELVVGDDAVVVAVSSPHRAEAFAAAKALIDDIKNSVPIWKFETWEGGSGWSQCHEPRTEDLS